jgi:hypothetical protein
MWFGIQDDTTEKVVKSAQTLNGAIESAQAYADNQGTFMGVYSSDWKRIFTAVPKQLQG